jgi:hypothetical protein
MWNLVNQVEGQLHDSRPTAKGQSLVVWTFNEGRAARECDRYLMGFTNLP